jgi:hypothetical protein
MRLQEKKESLNFNFNHEDLFMPIVTNGISTDIPAQTGVNTRLMRIVCTDNLATITAAGYLNPNDLEGYIVMPYDFFHIYYGSNSNLFGIFSVASIVDGVVTLQAMNGTASGATTVKDLASFSNTVGGLQDAGFRILSGTVTWGGGGTSNAFTIPGLTATSYGSCVLRTSGARVSLQSAVPSANALTVIFSADPGAGTSLDYIYTTAASS